jgi:hypothetical protein
MQILQQAFRVYVELPQLESAISTNESKTLVAKDESKLLKLKHKPRKWAVF